MPFSAGSRELSPVSRHRILIVLLLLAHAPLFLNGSMFMDDWLVLKPTPNYPFDINFLINGADAE